MKNTRIAFIGCGNMGQSLIGGLIANGHEPSALRGADPDLAKRLFITNKYSVSTHADNQSVVDQADVIVLAIKPQMLAETVSSLAGHIKPGQRQIDCRHGC